MTKQEIQEKVNAFMTDRLEYEAERLTLDTELKRDLGVSSVDATAIAAFIQKVFGCPIIMSELKAIITMQDLYDYIEKYAEC